MDKNILKFSRIKVRKTWLGIPIIKEIKKPLIIKLSSWLNNTTSVPKYKSIFEFPKSFSSNFDRNYFFSCYIIFDVKYINGFVFQMYVNCYTFYQVIFFTTSHLLQAFFTPASIFNNFTSVLQMYYKRVWV